MTLVCRKEGKKPALSCGPDRIRSGVLKGEKTIQKERNSLEKTMEPQECI
jgi:hypothetical protein